MNTVYVLSALLLVALIFIEVSFSLESKRKEQVKKLLKLDDSHLLDELSSAVLLLRLCLISGLLLSALYAVNTFAGSEIQHISEWGFTHWLGACIGLIVVVTVTLSQSFAHSAQMHHIGRFAVIILLMTFAIFSEVSNPMEREEMKMAQKSQDSAVFKAVLGEIKGGGSSQPDYSQALAGAQANLATHQFELKRCERHADKGVKRVQRCKDFENKAIAQAQAKIASYQQAGVNAANQSNVNKQALIKQASALEKNADNHSAVIKFIKTALNTDYVHAMVLAALILIVAFEAGFGFAGYNVAVYKEALIQKGNQDILYSIEAKRIKAAHTFREKTNRYQRAMMTTQDKDAPDATIKNNANPSQVLNTKDTVQPLDSKTNNIHSRAHDAVVANRAREQATEKEVGHSKESGKNSETGLSVIHQYAADYRKKKEQPTTAFTRNESTGTQEDNYDLFGAEKVKTKEQIEAEKVKVKSERSDLNASDSESTLNLTRKVSDDLTRKVYGYGEQGVKKEAKSTQNKDREATSALYLFVREQVKTGVINPTFIPMKKAVYDYLKSQKQEGADVPVMPRIQAVVEDIQGKLLNQGVIIKNPMAGHGKPTYIKA